METTYETMDERFETNGHDIDEDFADMPDLFFTARPKSVVGDAEIDD